jgi:hypothetical protein
LEYLDELLPIESSKLVGKTLKRLEILFPEKENYDEKKVNAIIPILKRELKELIYEEFRNMEDIFLAYKKGLEVTHIKFISKETNNGK